MPVRNRFVFGVIVHPVMTNLWFCSRPNDFILLVSHMSVVPLPQAIPNNWFSLWKAVWQLWSSATSMVCNLPFRSLVTYVAFLKMKWVMISSWLPLPAKLYITLCTKLIETTIFQAVIDLDRLFWLIAFLIDCIWQCDDYRCSNINLADYDQHSLLGNYVSSISGQGRPFFILIYKIGQSNHLHLLILSLHFVKNILSSK